MKTKLKGQGGVKGLLLLHGEKLLMGAVGIVAAYLAYSALGTERLTDQFQAEKLQAEIQRTKSAIISEENNWSKALREQPEKVKVDIPIKSDALAVAHQEYVPAASVLSPPVLAPRTPRTDPVILAAVDVQAHSGVDRMAFLDADYLQRHELRLREEAARKEAEQKRQQLLQGEDSSGRPAGAGRRTRNESGRSDEIDPDHPHRRRIEGVNQLGGVQLQGGELIELSRWIAVVAKVPIKNQLRLFRDSFEDKSGGFVLERDAPYYYGYLVERAEVLPGQAALNWRPVAVFDAKGTPTREQIGSAMSNRENGPYYILQEKAATEWARGDMGEVVNPRYLAPEGGLVYPLPPVVGRDWGRDATHPDIPLVTDASGAEASDLSGVATGATTRPQAGDAFRGGGSISLGGRGGGGGRGGFADRGGRSPSFDGGPRSAMPATRGRGDFPAERGRGGGGDGRGGGDATGAGLAGLPDVNDYLLRFFDFTVEPGKTYSYRVRLVLADPNIQLLATPNMLDESVLKRLRDLPKNPQTGFPIKDFVESPWSEPSPPIGVPLDGRVHVAGVAPGEEPKVSLLVDGFGRNAKSGGWIQASAIKDFTRGSVANFEENAEYVTNDQLYIDRADSFRFTTGVTVVDARGGDRLGGRNDYTSPARVVLMSPTGELLVRQELADASAVQSHQSTFTKTKGDSRQPADVVAPRR